MASHPKHHYTPAEYLALERTAPYKSEYYYGEIFAMSGASREHNIITLNVATLFNNQLEARDCEVYASEMRVRIPATNVYAYPDVVVVCGEPQFEDDCFDTLLNPTLIVEVLSPSSEKHDRTKKFADYRRIASLGEYVMIAQQECRVSQYLTQSESPWLFQEASSLSETISLVSIDCQLSLESVYRRIQFPSNHDSILPVEAAL